MDRRDFLRVLSTGTLGLAGCASFEKTRESDSEEGARVDEQSRPLKRALASKPGFVGPPSALKPEGVQAGAAELSQQEIEKRIEKSRHFSWTFDDDIFVEAKLVPVFKRVTQKLRRFKDVIGYEQFNLVSFDEMLKLAPFDADERDFMDRIFHTNAADYGFFGKKMITQLTYSIDKEKSVRIRGTGHFVLQGDSHELYQKIRKELGPTIVLTSGVRSVVKQLHLFLEKATVCGGNLSRASRSLAPPGHSYHGVGDFDVGKVGLGERNFSDYFATTVEYRKLIESGYVQIRYPADNLLGVRYEPWHIKVVSA